METTAMNKTAYDIVKKITDTINPVFSANGFKLKNKKYFEYNDDKGNLFQYEINLKKTKGYYSLHLMLNVFNETLMVKVNELLGAVLRSDRYEYPLNWSSELIESTIKSRVKSKLVYSVTDWRIFKKNNESLEEFNSRFSIWFCVFDDIDEKQNWEEQLIESVNMAIAWFFDIYNIEWVINNTDYPSLFLLKNQNKMNELMERYSAILLTSRLKKEIELFMEYLNKE